MIYVTFARDDDDDFDNEFDDVGVERAGGERDDAGSGFENDDDDDASR